MTEVSPVAVAPIAMASTVPPATPVVVAAVHVSIVKFLEADLAYVEAELERAWQSKDVGIFIIIAFVLGALTRFI